MKENKKILIACIAGACVFVCLLITFFVSSKEYFSGDFAPHAIVSNTDVSAMSVEEAVEKMNAAEGFTITLIKENQEYKIDISQAVSREFNQEQVKSKKEDISFADYLFHRDVVLSLQPNSVEVNMEMLLAILQRQLPQSTKFTADAYFDKDLNLVNEVQGDDVDMQKLMSAMEQDIKSGNEIRYELSDYYNQPKVKSSDKLIVSQQKDIETYRNMKITFTFGDDAEVIDGAMISEHLTYKKGKLKLSNKWVPSFVRELAKKYNTYGKTRKFKTTKDGVKKIHGGIMGWWINEDETVKKVNKLLKKKKSSTIEPVYRNQAAQHGKDDIGKTYVEISIARQHLWFYKDGKLKMESDIVTGLPTKERKTVTGVHRIYGKQKDRYLGTIAVQGYRSHVNYWMPFNWDGQGLHDATWRRKFGKNLYIRGGSHGCVNMPLNNAAKLYDYVSIGTPVVVY